MPLKQLMVLFVTILFSVQNYAFSQSVQKNQELSSQNSLEEIQDEISKLKKQLIYYRAIQGVEVIGVMVTAVVAKKFGGIVFKSLTTPGGLVDARMIVAATGVFTAAVAGTGFAMGHHIYTIQTNKIPLLISDLEKLDRELQIAIAIKKQLND